MKYIRWTNLRLKIMNSVVGIRKLPQPYMKNPQLTSYSVVKIESLSSKTRIKTGMSTFTTSVQYIIASSSQSN